MMHIHILGICGTFMGGVAVLASELGFKVTGSDQNVYPPISTQLNELGVKIFQGYEDISQLLPKPDIVIMGNVMRRGMPVVEAALNQNLTVLSGPEWIARFVLKNRQTLAVSGTHGKTTTASMLAWILECAGLHPGFLIGGVPNDFGISARLGTVPYFVVEADEYDSAFFDKRSKFIHYRPRILIINNIEFDHADIFSDLAAIQTQFHHLIRTVPGNGLIIYPNWDKNITQVLKKGCWTTTKILDRAKQSMTVKQLQSFLLGEHNVENALSAIAAASHAGVDCDMAIQALQTFKGVKRRMEIKGVRRGITVYDDFAHHPTAIQSTLAGLRNKVGLDAHIIAVLDIRSNTMKAGHHKEALAGSVGPADCAYFYQSSDIAWDVHQVWQDTDKPGGVYQEIGQLVNALLLNIPHDNTHVVFMSNGGFSNIHSTFLEKL